MPPCRESLAPASPGVLAFDGTTEQFGPLAPAPSLDVALPALTEVLPDGTTARVRTVARPVNGGALVGLGLGGGNEAGSSVLAVVELDGTKRWVRCFSSAVDAWVASPVKEPTTALVATSRYVTGTGVVADWQLIAVDTGRTTTGFADAAHRIGVDPSILATANAQAFSPTAVLLNRSARDPGADTASTNLLVRYDLVEESLIVVPPPSPDGYAGAEYTLGPGDDVLAWVSGSVAAVYHGGEWRRDDASRLAARPIEVRFELNGDPGWRRSLEGVDGLGRIVWSNDQIADPALEGLSIITDGPVTLVNACPELHPDLSCDRYELVGVDTATGAIRWQLAGLRGVVVAADGWALVTVGGLTTSDSSPDQGHGYVMVDDRTGAVVDDTQHWQAGTFAQGCCGEDQYLWVERAGAVIFATDGEHLRVWYPKATWQGTATTSLP